MERGEKFLWDVDELMSQWLIPKALGRRILDVPELFVSFGCFIQALYGGEGGPDCYGS